MDCTYLECGCVVSCNEPKGMLVWCDMSGDCKYKDWLDDHIPCQKCGLCICCGKCSCPERFGI
jgi:hypothetical protein